MWEFRKCLGPVGNTGHVFLVTFLFRFLVLGRGETLRQHGPGVFRVFSFCRARLNNYRCIVYCSGGALVPQQPSILYSVRVGGKAMQ